MFDVNKIRQDFPMLKNNSNVIYFDSAATSLKPQSVIDAVNNFYTHGTSNIHRGDYDISFTTSKAYDNARVTLKEFINAEKVEEIVFTSGDTESLNTVTRGYMENYLTKGDVILTTELEHASSILPLYKVCDRVGAQFKLIKLNEDGSFNLNNLEELLKEGNVKFVCVTYVSNVLGLINPIKEIVQLAHKYNSLVLVDGAQAVPHIKVDVKGLDVDFMTFSGHKMLGTSGVGVLYGKLDLLDKTEPLMQGGGANARFDNCGNIILKKTPTKFEAGTPNIEGVIGMAEAAKYLMNIGMEEIHQNDSKLVRYAIDELSKLENVEVYNPTSECSLVTFNVKGIFAQDAASYLNANGICVRSGNHCAKILHNVIGSTETIRASLYFYNTKEEVDKFIKVVSETTLEKCIGAVI